jgi:hypothetical protein
MVHGRVEEKLDRRWKLFVPSPKDILKRDIREGLENERGVPDVYGVPSRLDTHFFKPFGRFPEFSLQRFCHPPCKNTCIKQASWNIFVCHPFPRERTPFCADEIMEQEDTCDQGHHFFEWGVKFYLGKTDMVRL